MGWLLFRSRRNPKRSLKGPVLPQIQPSSNQTSPPPAKSSTVVSLESLVKVNQTPPIPDSVCGQVEASTQSLSVADKNPSMLSVDSTQEESNRLDPTQEATAEDCKEPKSTKHASFSFKNKFVVQSVQFQTPSKPSSDSTLSLQRTQEMPSVKLPNQKKKTEKREVTRKRSVLPPIVVPGSFLMGDDTQKQHEKKCYEMQRKTRRGMADNQRMKPCQFLTAVNLFRDSRNVMTCICKPESLGCCKNFKFYVSQCCQHTGSFCNTFCCPPLPKYCFTKCAFWPPNRGYFFVKFDPSKPWSYKDVEKNRIIKANREISVTEELSMGLEHNCSDRLEDVTPFVFKNTSHQYIAALLAKPIAYTDVKLWVIYAHPNGSDMSDLLTLMPSPVHVAEFLGCNVVFYDYPGYGISSGKSNESTFFDTEESVIKYVNIKFGVPYENMVLWGYSVGTSCSLHSAMSRLVAGVLLFAPFASIMKIIKRHGKVTEKTCCIDSFRNIDMISKVKSPILVCHGMLDTFIPMKHGEALVAEALKNNKNVYNIWCKDVTHDNLMNSSELWNRVKEFFDTQITNAAGLKATLIPRQKKKKKKAKSNETGRDKTKKADKDASNNNVSAQKQKIQAKKQTPKLDVEECDPSKVIAPSKDVQKKKPEPPKTSENVSDSKQQKSLFAKNTAKLVASPNKVKRC